MRSLNWLGSLKTLDRVLENTNKIFWARESLNDPKDCMYLVYGKEMKIINLGQDFLYIRELYSQLRELSLLVTGCSM
jgi:hypothetical protein